ncbi:hypothetical protein V5O48_013671 [Marasmius crinis-equi]|uniref:BTB domain-containing protein n=1 Tax=Marasmius crinis-equi TaxID=585013 RepID=A0ABR3EZG5_9AGAR
MEAKTDNPNLFTPSNRHTQPNTVESGSHPKAPDVQPSPVDVQPFNTFRGDATILTADNVIFIVQKVCLTLISTYFDALFARTPGMFWDQERQKTVSAPLTGAGVLPIFQIEEDRETFRRVLSYVYPGLYRILPKHHAQAVRVCKALVRYCMEDTQAFDRTLSRLLSASQRNEEKITSFAFFYRLKETAQNFDIRKKDLITRLLKVRFSVLATTHSPEMDETPPMPVAALTQLLKYHQSINDAISTHVPAFRERPTGSPKFKYLCPTVHPRAKVAITCDDLAQVFHYLRFSDDVLRTCLYLMVSSSESIERASENPGCPVSCSHCKTTGCRGLIDFARQLMKSEVAKATQDVSSTFDCHSGDLGSLNLFYLH